MDLQLSGKRALITGGSKGIGRAVAEVLAEEGCHLVLCAREQAALEDAAGAIRSRRQVDVAVISADLSSDAAVREVAAKAGPLDILVNNAGAIPAGDLLAVDNDTWRKAWDLKVFGFISLTRAVYPQMKARGEGAIVNVIGAAGERFPSGYIAGAAGNASLMGFTRALGSTSASDGVRVVGLNPGPVATARLERQNRVHAERLFGDGERWREMFAQMPFGRPAEPREIADVVAFLASPRSSYVSGTIVTVDGGGAQPARPAPGSPR
jgi:NAD(P)-dependent dehydrogenase (short-subunit alcohol dehydrogenase family)